MIASLLFKTLFKVLRGLSQTLFKVLLHPSKLFISLSLKFTSKFSTLMFECLLNLGVPLFMISNRLI